MTEDDVMKALTYLRTIDRWLSTRGLRLGDRHYVNAMNIARGGSAAPHDIEDSRTTRPEGGPHD